MEVAWDLRAAESGGIQSEFVEPAVPTIAVPDVIWQEECATGCVERRAQGPGAIRGLPVVYVDGQGCGAVVCDDELVPGAISQAVGRSEICPSAVARVDKNGTDAVHIHSESLVGAVSAVVSDSAGAVGVDPHLHRSATAPGGQT